MLRHLLSFVPTCTSECLFFKNGHNAFLHVSMFSSQDQGVNMALLCVSYTNDYFSCFSCYHCEVQSHKKKKKKASPATPSTYINDSVHTSTYGHSESQNTILLHWVFCFSSQLPLTWNFPIRTRPFCICFLRGEQNICTNIKVKGNAIFENYITASLL